MSCPEFDKNGLLFISGELDLLQAKSYREHLKTCAPCVAEVKEMRAFLNSTSRLSEAMPSPEVRQSILQQSRRRPANKHVFQKFESWFQQQVQNQRLIWGASTIVTAAVLFILLINPFSGVKNLTTDDALAWNDDFLLESLYLEAEMENMNSISGLSIIEEYYDDEIDNMSTMTDDFSTIRNGIEGLLQEINAF